MRTPISENMRIVLKIGQRNIVKTNQMLQINLPKQELLRLTVDGKPRELIVSKEPLKGLKDQLEKELAEPTAQE